MLSVSGWNPITKDSQISIRVSGISINARKNWGSTNVPNLPQFRCERLSSVCGIEPSQGLWLVAAAALACGGSAAPPTTDMEFSEPTQWDPETYVARRTDTRLVIDGKLDESVWRSAEWTKSFMDIEGSVRPPPRFNTRAKMLWDDIYFYVAAEMEEPHVWAKLTDRDAVIYYDNDFEVFIDPDGDTHEYYELEINAFGTEWDLLLVRPYRDGGPAINAWDIQGLKTAVSVDGTINRPDDRDRGWSVEIAIPWAVLKEAANKPAPPKPGDQWRVNFSRVQWRTIIENGEYVRELDNSPGRTRPEDNWVWSPQGLINMHYPEMWGIVQFSASLSGLGNDSVTVSIEDRAKWELRRVYYRQHAWFDTHQSFADRLGDLGLGESDWPITLAATRNLFEATLEVNGKTLRIRQDGRVW